MGIHFQPKQDTSSIDIKIKSNILTGVLRLTLSWAATNYLFLNLVAGLRSLAWHT
ncbi:conserved hypothetical protein [Ricinus communis]|uniref:Uncharacterized protein n=1 Tax=Ricinus communis TaxID=3988 RepID=B9RP85_RICCO|nr:conserved hypothetical protein [Ricinus communis]